MEQQSSSSSSSNSHSTDHSNRGPLPTINSLSYYSPSSSQLAYDMEKTQEVDVPLHSVGFFFEVLTPTRVTGHMLVSQKCVQPFKVLHGGVSALIAEGMASVGAHMASGFKRVAGIHLSINHHKSATVGDLILGEAVPINVGKTIQVWEVKLYKVDPSKEAAGERLLVASSKVTLLSNMPVPDNAKDAGHTLRKYARL